MRLVVACAIVVLSVLAAVALTATKAHANHD
jgi:hypothetical protein